MREFHFDITWGVVYATLILITAVTVSLLVLHSGGVIK